MLGRAKTVRTRAFTPADDEAERVNQTIRYSGWSVFRSPDRRGVAADRLSELSEVLPSAVTVRGWYDVSVFRADAELMVWWHADDVLALQTAQRQLLDGGLAAPLVPVWSAVGLHRAAEFNRRHVPAFMTGQSPRRFVSVYPFSRSHEWYLLPAEQRFALLHEHGAAARAHPDVLANTVSAFGLGDDEWVLAFEADELHRIVDLLRHLRATGARRHVRTEVPFYTGARLEVDDHAAPEPAGDASGPFQHPAEV